MSLSQLRPLESGEILDGAFVLYRRHLRTFAAVGLLAHAPGFLVCMAAPVLSTRPGAAPAFAVAG